MIKTRLVGLLSHAKKYIVYTILWQWAALLSQVIAVFTIADLLERVVYGAVTATAVKRTVFMLAIVVVIRFFCERMGARSSYLACVDVKRILREKIYEKMLKLGASYSEQVSSSEVVQVSGRRGAARNLFWKVSSAAVLQPDCAAHAVRHPLPGEHESERDSSDLCAADPDFDCGCAEDCEEAAEQILEYLHRARRFVP